MNNRICLLPPAKMEEILQIDSVDEIQENYSNYLHDESKFSVPGVKNIFFPSSTNQVSGLFQKLFLNKQSWAISGARTGVVGGAVPEGVENLVSLDRLKGISDLAITSDSPTIKVQAGTTLFELNQYLEDNCGENYFFPVDPTETWASIGGMAATNAAGPRAYFYGTMRKWIKSLVVVLVDGSILKVERGQVFVKNQEVYFENSPNFLKPLTAQEIKKPCVKNSLGITFYEGMDLVDLFIGAEGTLGAITELELYLEKNDSRRLQFIQFFESEDKAISFVHEIRSLCKTKELEVLCIEYCDNRGINFAKQNPKVKELKLNNQISEDTNCYLYFEVHYQDEEQLEKIYNLLAEKLETVGTSIENSFAGVTERERVEIKSFRHATPEMINSLIARHKIKIPELRKVATDMAVPDEYLSKVFELYRKCLDAAISEDETSSLAAKEEKLESTSKLDYAIFGHIGDNHLHVNIIPNSKAQFELAWKVYQKLAKEVVSWGGAVSAEHGIGRLKKKFLQLQYNEAELSNMKMIKDYFDKDGLINPGVLF